MAFNTLEALSFLNECNDLVSFMSLKSKQLQDVSQYEPIRRRIITCATKVLGISVEVKFFGSRVIGVATDKSSLDICVRIDKEVFETFTKFEMLQNLMSALESSGMWQFKGQAMKADDPDLFTNYKPLQLDCDISIVEVGTRHSELLARFFDIQPEAVSLVHFVKTWLKLQGFDHFKGFTITLMVIVFLQSKNLMPAGNADQQTFINVRKMISYKSYMKEFFKFYRDFNYFKVMSISTGREKIEYKIFGNTVVIKKGIYIDGPFSDKRNCDVAVDCYIDEFIVLCKSSFNFLRFVGYLT